MIGVTPLVGSLSTLALCVYEGRHYSLGESWMEDGCLQCTCLHPVGVGCCETWVHYAPVINVPFWVVVFRFAAVGIGTWLPWLGEACNAIQPWNLCPGAEVLVREFSFLFSKYLIIMFFWFENKCKELYSPGSEMLRAVLHYLCGVVASRYSYCHHHAFRESIYVKQAIENV